MVSDFIFHMRDNLSLIAWRENHQLFTSIGGFNFNICVTKFMEVFSVS